MPRHARNPCWDDGICAAPSAGALRRQVLGRRAGVLVSHFGGADAARQATDEALGTYAPRRRFSVDGPGGGAIGFGA